VVSWCSELSSQLAAAAVSTAAAAAAAAAVAGQSSPGDVAVASSLPPLDLSSDEFVGNLQPQTNQHKPAITYTTVSGQS